MKMDGVKFDRVDVFYCMAYYFAVAETIHESITPGLVILGAMKPIYVSNQWEIEYRNKRYSASFGSERVY